MGRGQAGRALPVFITLHSLTVLRGRSMLIEFVLAEAVLVPVNVNSWELL